MDESNPAVCERPLGEIQTETLPIIPALNHVVADSKGSMSAGSSYFAVFTRRLTRWAPIAAAG